MKDTRKRWSWPIVGAIAGAVGASVCCLGPLILVALGMTGAWIGGLSSLGPYRPYFVVVSVLLLGISFYRVYRRRPKRCASEDGCEEKRAWRLSVALVWIGTILIIGIIALPYVLPALYVSYETSVAVTEIGDPREEVTSASAEIANPVASASAGEPVGTESHEDVTVTTIETSTAILQVENLTCASCVSHATNRLSALKGVVSVEVTRRPPRAVVRYDPSTISVGDLADVLTSIGYPASPLTDEE